MKRANYQIVRHTSDYLLIQDVGPHDQYLTVTNAAETVVEELAPRLGSRRLFYYDSDGQLDELLVKDGVFNGFAPGPDELPSV